MRDDTGAKVGAISYDFMVSRAADFLSDQGFYFLFLDFEDSRKDPAYEGSFIAFCKALSAFYNGSFEQVRGDGALFRFDSLEPLTALREWFAGENKSSEHISFHGAVEKESDLNHSLFL